MTKQEPDVLLHQLVADLERLSEMHVYSRLWWGEQIRAILRKIGEPYYSEKEVTL